MQLERQALFWTAIALLFAYLVQLLAPVLLPFVLGLTLAYFFNPLSILLGRIGLPRWASAILLLAISTCLDRDRTDIRRPDSRAAGRRDSLKRRPEKLGA